MSEKMMTCDLRDVQFRKVPGAVLVTGFYGDPWISQYPGSGYSAHEFKFKGLMVDGVLYIPDPDYTTSRDKSKRDYAHYPMVRARHQPPARCIQPV
jgi:hypothetical protein